MGEMRTGLLVKLLTAGALLGLIAPVAGIIRGWMPLAWRPDVVSATTMPTLAGAMFGFVAWLIWDAVLESRARRDVYRHR